jgi:hypothetical protein
MRPACQLFGTVNDTDWYAFCCQPVVYDGTALATFKSVNIYATRRQCSLRRPTTIQTHRGPDDERAVVIHCRLTGCSRGHGHGEDSEGGEVLHGWRGVCEL